MPRPKGRGFNSLPKEQRIDGRGRPICGALKGDGTYCQAAQLENGRCFNHGGRSLTGQAAPKYKTGTHSKVIPLRLKDSYEASREDEELLSLKEEIALCVAREQELLGMLESGESGAAWKELKKGLRQLRNARDRSDVKAGESAMQVILEVCDRGNLDFDIWDNIQGILALRMKLTEVENKRLLNNQQMISIDKMLSLVGIITGIFQKAVNTYVEGQAARNILADTTNGLRVIVAQRSDSQPLDAGKLLSAYSEVPSEPD